MMDGLRDRVGQRLGAFTLDELLGVGDGSVVWLGRGGGQTAAIRIDERPEAPDAESRYARIRQLQHPNLMQVFGAGRTDEGDPYYICELHEGQPLAEVLAEGRPLPLEPSVRLVAQILDALDHAHRSGLMSLSPQPSGIFLGSDQRVKLRPIHGGDEASLAARLATVNPQLPAKDMRYAAPERIVSGQGGPPADLYAVGAILYHMLTGRPPFEAPGGTGLAREHLLGQVPSVQFGNPSVSVPSGVAAFLDRALAKRPETRFQSASAMRRALLSVSGVRLPRPSVPLPPPAPPPPESLGIVEPTEPPPEPRPKWVMPVLVALLACAAVTLGVLFSRL